MSLRNSFAILAGLAGAASTLAADRTIPLSPIMTQTWSFSTGEPTVRSGPGKGGLMAGFWQRSSGAKIGVGSDNIATAEFQLPETAAVRVRSATYQFSGRASQCSGAEAVVFDVYAYPGDGKPTIADASTHAGRAADRRLQGQPGVRAPDRRHRDRPAAVGALGHPARGLQHPQGQPPAAAGLLLHPSGQVDGGARRRERRHGSGQ